MTRWSCKSGVSQSHTQRGSFVRQTGEQSSLQGGSQWELNKEVWGESKLGPSGWGDSVGGSSQDRGGSLRSEVKIQSHNPAEGEASGRCGAEAETERIRSWMGPGVRGQRSHTQLRGGRQPGDRGGCVGSGQRVPREGWAQPRGKFGSGLGSKGGPGPHRAGARRARWRRSSRSRPSCSARAAACVWSCPGRRPCSAGAASCSSRGCGPSGPGGWAGGRPGPAGGHGQVRACWAPCPPQRPARLRAPIPGTCPVGQ